MIHSGLLNAVIVCLCLGTAAKASQNSVAEIMIDSVRDSFVENQTTEQEPSEQQPSERPEGGQVDGLQASVLSPTQTVLTLEQQPSALQLDLPLDLEIATSSDEANSDSGVEWLPSWESWTSPERLTGSIRVVCVMAALSLAPALLLMTTCYVRLIVVLSLLRQALGSQQLPPNQVTTTLAMFLTALIMWPVWSEVHKNAIEPYTDPNTEMSAEEAWTAGVSPIREFMSKQISMAGNQADVKLFLEYLGETEASTFADVPLQALLPAFLISELKVAFLIGFLVFLPFVIIDLVVASVTMSMGWVMVPPTTISLPLKLMLFVLVDGWHYVVQMLLMSFQV